MLRKGINPKIVIAVFKENEALKDYASGCNFNSMQRARAYIQNELGLYEPSKETKQKSRGNSTTIKRYIP